MKRIRLPLIPGRILGVMILFGTSGLSSAAQFGDFTYVEIGSYVSITGYPTTAIGEVTVPATINAKPVKRIGSGAFSDCSSITKVILPAGVLTIDQDAFAYSGVTSINFPAGLTSIGPDAFAYCHGITSVSLPASLSTLSVGAFSTCSSLGAISVNAANPSFTSEDGVLFNKTQTTLIQYPYAKSGAYVVPSTVTRIGDEAFFGADGLSSATLPAGLTVLGRDAFYGCGGLSQINLPAGLTTIGDRAFSYSGLTSISLPSSVATVGIRAFANSQSLASAVVPESVTSLGLGVFSDCGSLTSISVSSANANYSEKDGVVFNKSGTSLIQFPTGRGGHYSVPVGVTSIASNAFSGSRSLVSVSLPPGITSISDSAFFVCKGLVSVQLPAGLTSIGSSAFWSCSSLTNVTIPSTVTSLAFYSFYGCSSLANVTFRGNAPVITSGAFTSTPSSLKLRYYQNRTGFTTPTWQGYNTVNLGDLSENPADILVHAGVGAELQSGGIPENFGSPELGTSVERTFTIRNAGEQPLADLSAICEGAHAKDFIPGPLTAEPLVSGGATTFTVKFQPSAAGQRMAVLRIFSSDADEDPFEIALQGGAVLPAPEIIVMQPAGSKLVDGTAKKSFGTVATGSAKGARRIFTIKNTGSVDLSDLAIRKDGKNPGDFTVGALGDTVLAPGAKTTFIVTFKPKAKGTRSAAIHIGSNDADENPFDIQLTGMGVNP